MKHIMKILSAVLILTLLIGVLPVFAADGQTQYLLLGDSIAAGTGLDDATTQCYGALVADADSFVYTNDAVGGTTSAGLVTSLSDETVAADVAKADIISISIGGNDFLLGDMATMIYEAALLGDYSAFDEIAAQLCTNIATIIQTIKGLNPDALIVMQTLYNPRNDSLGDIYQQGTDRINAAITKYLEENPDSYVIADVAAAMDGDETLIQSDVFHPNAAGHIVIANTILQLLYNLGYGTATAVVPVGTNDPEPTPILLPALLFLLYTIVSYLGRLF